MYMNKTRIINRNILIISLLLILTVLVLTLRPVKAEAAASISISEINYFNSTITLKVNDSDSVVYFSDSKKTSWETVPGEINSSNMITMDISWVTSSKSYVMTFKADKSTSVISVTLPKLITNFKATYNKVKSTVSFNNAGSRTIEWRKKDSAVWSTVDTNTISTELSYLNTNGATVYFRLAPVNGTGIGNVGYRSSSEVSIVIPKKSSAPSITINGSALSIAVKKGMAYRTVYSDTSSSDWTTISSTSNLLLKNIAAKAMYTNESTTQAEVTLQFRTNATNTTQVSGITTVTVPMQEGPPDEDTYGITLSYTSSSTLSLQVKAASSTVPFEYTVVEADDELNYQTASWVTISSSTAISLNDDTAEEGYHIYLRKKSVNVTGDDDYALASVETDVTGTSGVTYPDSPTTTSLTTLISTAGVCQTSDSSSYLTFQLYSATSTTVSAIHFLDSYGIDKGTVTIKSTVAKNTDSKTELDKYIITTKITSTSSLNSITEELLYAKITLANSDVITSSDAAGILLYLYPCTVVNNPTGDDNIYDEYTSSFQRIYLSNDTDDDSSFKFKLDLGTINIPSDTVVNSFTSQAMAITSIKYDSYSLSSGTDYTVVYGSYVNDDDETIATATVTVNVSAFEKSSLIDITNTAEPLHITLNNGETMNNDINLTLTNTATLNNTPLAWTITEGKLKETTTSTITNSDDSTTTVTEEVITYNLTLTLFSKSYGVAVSDVTWGGVSVLGSTTITNGTATIYLSNAKLNKLTTTSTTTNNIVITLSNGFTITSGCKLTILNASN
jgi:hypothetical protein